MKIAQVLRRAFEKLLLWRVEVVKLGEDVGSVAAFRDIQIASMGRTETL